MVYGYMKLTGISKSYNEYPIGKSILKHSPISRITSIPLFSDERLDSIGFRLNTMTDNAFSSVLITIKPSEPLSSVILTITVSLNTV